MAIASATMNTPMRDPVSMRRSGSRKLTCASRTIRPHHLLIESSFLGAQDALQFRIYSTPHWRTVIESAIVSEIVPAPEAKFVEADDLAAGQARQIDYSADGADVWVYRNVYDAAGALVKRDQLFTRYQPWQAVFEVAPGDPRLEVEEEEEDASNSG